MKKTVIVIFVYFYRAFNIDFMLRFRFILYAELFIHLLFLCF